VAHPQIAAFARSANGAAEPRRSIAGQNTLITRTIHDMAYDHIHDEIVVPQCMTFAILTFAGNADGNVPPIRKIFGPDTQIKNNDAVSIDPVHNEYFVPQDDNRLLVFDRMANGNVKPKRILITDDPDPNRVTVDYVHNLLIVSGGPKIRIYRREAEGKEKPLRVITIPKEYYPKGIDDGAEGGQQNQTALMTINSQRGLVFVNTRIGGRFALEDFVGVWSVFDDGEVYPLYTIGGPNNLLKDVRGIALDPKEKMVIVSDKTHNAIFNFHVAEVF